MVRHEIPMRRAGQYYPPAMLKCSCGKCRRCKSRQYARQHAARVQADARNAEIYGRQMTIHPDGHEVSRPRNACTEHYNADRLEGFFARREMYWRARIDMILSA